MRWPSPCQRGDGLAAENGQQRHGEADAQPGEDHRQRRRQQHIAEHLQVGGAHRARRGDEDLVDVAEARDRVQHDREEADGGAERDLRSRAEPEEQHVERQEQDDRDRIEAGQQRLEHPDEILRAADEIAERDAGGAGNREGDGQLGQRHPQIGQIFARGEHVLQLGPDVHRIGQQDAADAPVGGPEIPEPDQRGEKADLHREAGDLVPPVPPRAHGCGATVADCSTALRISSCSRP